MTDFAHLFADLRSVFGMKLFLLAMLMAVVGVTEGMSIVLLLPLLARLGVAGSMDKSGLAANLLGSLNAWLGDRIEPLVALIVVTIVLSSALFLLQNWLLAALSQHYAAQWKQRQLRAFFGARWPFFTKHKAGELLNAIITEPGRLSAAALNMLSLMTSVIVGLTYLTYAMLLSWQATLLLLAGFAILVLSIKRLYGKSRTIGGAMGPLNAKQQVVIGEFLQAAKLVKAAAIENVAIERSMVVVRDLEIVQRRAVYMPSLVRGIFEAAGLTMLVLMLVFSSTMINATANLFVVLALFLRLFPRITTLQQYIHHINTYAPAVVTLRSLCEEAEAVAEADAARGPGEPALVAPGSIEIRELVTEYDGERVLDGVTLSIPVPGFVALLGPSGAGKSTLLNCLLGLVPWSEGTVEVNGVPLQNLDLKSWRHAIGYIPQETMLFHATIRENIAMLKPQATAAEIDAACHRARLGDFLAQSEHGLDTVIGDQGLRLSGGQRQRLALARALLCQPKLLLLDEATSALDEGTESEILDQLQELSREVAVLFVTHRESVARRADRSYVLTRGRIGQMPREGEEPNRIDGEADRSMAS